MKKPFAAAAAVVAAALAVPASGSAATLEADPPKRCYREQETVHLPGAGFTGNTRVDFFRDGAAIAPEQPIVTDAAGGMLGRLVLPGLLSGQRRFVYTAVDSANPANAAEVGLLVTATDVILRPARGALNRPLTVIGRGFFRGRTLWAHVLRRKRRGSPAVRTVRVGRLRGACRKVRAKRRLFRRGVSPGRYRIQFDTFRRYRPGRAIDVEYDVTLS